MDADHLLNLIASAPMKLSAEETFGEYAARVWPTRAQTGLPEDDIARFIFRAATVRPPRNQFLVS